MSRDKQISEIAKVLNECCNNYDKNGNLLGNKCWACPYWCDTNHICCSYNTKEATALYNAGYRRASDLAEEIFADIHNTLLKVIGVVDEGLDRSIRNDNEEAKLIHAGTLEILKCLILIFAKLKKKYIGKDTNVTTNTEEGK